MLAFCLLAVACVAAAEGPWRYVWVALAVLAVAWLVISFTRPGQKRAPIPPARTVT